MFSSNCIISPYFWKYHGLLLTVTEPEQLGLVKGLYLCKIYDLEPFDSHVTIATIYLLFSGIFFILAKSYMIRISTRNDHYS